MRNLFKILSISADAKTIKGEKSGYLTAIVYMAPSNESEVINVCPHASEGCRHACLYTAGMGRFPTVKRGRILKTIWFAERRNDFVETLNREIKMFGAIAEAKGMIPCVRLNGTSDLPWENLGVIEKHPSIQFYDYTKNIARCKPDSKARKLKNYHLTFSRSESNDDKCLKAIQYGVNVAVVFAKNFVREKFFGLPIADGDENDLRFLQTSQCVIGLTAKGMAKKDESGFVISNA